MIKESMQQVEHGDRVVDWGVFWTAFFGALVVALPSILAAWRTAKVASKNSEDIKGVHNELNSRLTMLLLATKQAAHAAGKEEGRAEDYNKKAEG